MLARQRADQSTVDCENHELVVIFILSVFDDVELTI